MSVHNLSSLSHSHHIVVAAVKVSQGQIVKYVLKYLTLAEQTKRFYISVYWFTDHVRH